MPHETPLHMLGRLLERIAQMRGSPIVCCGQTEIRRTFGDSGATRHIQPDQMVFLDPVRLDRMASPYLNAGEDPYPDVVVEVDSTTDVRRNRLKLYEAWGFPEVWVEVPDAYAPSRPAGLQSGLRIYLLGRGSVRAVAGEPSVSGLAGGRDSGLAGGGDPRCAERAGHLGRDLGDPVAGGPRAG